MEQGDLAVIASLVDEVLAAVASSENQARKKRQPRAVFGMEEPIAWTKIFGFDANRYFTDPEFYFEMVLRQKLWRWKHFPLDDAPITADIPAWLGHYPEYTLVGMNVAFSPEGIPNIQTDHPLTRQPDLNLLKPVDFKTSGWMPRLLRWYDDLQKISAGRLPVSLYEITGIWWRGCLDLAVELRGYENIVVDVIERPHFVHDLLKWLVAQRFRWYEAYYQHFGLKPTPVFLGDDWINVPFITPSMFADFVLPRYLEIEAFHGGISQIHSCGNQVPVQKYLLEIKSLEGLEISPWSDMDQSLANIPPEKKICLSIHANDVLLAPPQQMRDQLRRLTSALAHRKYEAIGTSGLTPVTSDISEFITQVWTWTETAAEVMKAVRKT